MSIESELFDALGPTFSNRVYPDFGPPSAVMPFCTYQNIGGTPAPTFCGDPVKENSVFQINVWAQTRNQANSLMRTISQALTGVPMFGTAQGGIIGNYDTTTKTYAAIRDFSFWR